MRTLIITLMLAVMTAANAQTNGNDKAKVAEIRAKYSMYKELAARNKNEEAPRSDMTITSNYIIPGCGPTKENIYYAFDLQQDGETGSDYYWPYLIERSYNVAARNYYQEYLYDRNNHSLLFVYVKETSFNGQVNETRYYYGDDSWTYHTVKGEQFGSSDEMLYLGTRLIEGFGYIMNCGD